MPESSSFVLVVGATGKQGGAVARALLRSDVPVHALVRDPDTESAAALGALGAVLVRGDLDDVASLKAALDGARAVFSVQTPDATDLVGDSEVRRGRNLVETARAAGAEHFVHTSVSGAGTVDVERFDEQRWGTHMLHYWRSKAAIEDLVRAVGFPQWTILRPATFMENFIRPSFYFAGMTSDRLLVAVDPDVRLPFVAVDDIGAAAAAAFAEPRRFHGVELELAGDVLSFRTAARVLSEVLGATIELPASPEHARANGLVTELFLAQRYMSAHPAPARPEFAANLGIPLTAFHQWAQTALRGRPSGSNGS
ncbi:NmrA/HSCARG family protein [Streptosporangium carneum]|uniref:NmrA family transcriptional regulator n=1 Tax=Streptosporangium carneum TaxID=47481 RepID=A0A9W6I0R9_9ACTN|nr:NmrA/HSCARG family protein [Streptosporangium carneum]GLK09149.1 NmrA family transcriptional regulator [Streptosporangium carneum]